MRGNIGKKLSAREALDAGLVTAAPDDLDWEDEIRQPSNRAPRNRPMPSRGSKRIYALDRRRRLRRESSAGSPRGKLDIHPPERRRCEWSTEVYGTGAPVNSTGKSLAGRVGPKFEEIAMINYTKKSRQRRLGQRPSVTARVGALAARVYGGGMTWAEREP